MLSSWTLLKQNNSVHIIKVGYLCYRALKLINIAFSNVVLLTNSSTSNKIKSEHLLIYQALKLVYSYIFKCCPVQYGIMAKYPTHLILSRPTAVSFGNESWNVNLRALCFDVSLFCSMNSLLLRVTVAGEVLWTYSRRQGQFWWRRCLHTLCRCDS